MNPVVANLSGRSSLVGVGIEIRLRRLNPGASPKIVQTRQVGWSSVLT